MAPVSIREQGHPDKKAGTSNEECYDQFHTDLLSFDTTILSTKI
jgi:hypothetical protein